MDRWAIGELIAGEIAETLEIGPETKSETFWAGIGDNGPQIADRGLESTSGQVLQL